MKSFNYPLSTKIWFPLQQKLDLDISPKTKVTNDDNSLTYMPVAYQ